MAKMLCLSADALRNFHVIEGQNTRDQITIFSRYKRADKFSQNQISYSNASFYIPLGCEWVHPQVTWMAWRLVQRKEDEQLSRKKVCCSFNPVGYFTCHMYRAQSIKQFRAAKFNNLLDVVGRMYDWINQHFGKTNKNLIWVNQEHVTHRTQNCSLPNFKPRGAGYMSVYYGMNNVRPTYSERA